MTTLATVTTANRQNQPQTRNVTSVAYAQRLWSNFLDMQERFESGRPVAGNATRARLSALASELEANAKLAWDARHANKFAARVTLNRWVRLETDLGKLEACAPSAEDFSVRRAPWAWEPDADRIEGATEELQAELEAVETAAIEAAQAISRTIKTASNKCALAAVGVKWCNMREVWELAKSQMRELGAEKRADESWARALQRELRLRERPERLSKWETSGHEGSTECDSDYDLPEIQPAHDDRDLAQMSKARNARDAKFQAYVAKQSRQYRAGYCKTRLEAIK